MALKILLVDDDPIARRVVERVLTSEPRLRGLEPHVLHASDGQKALTVQTRVGAERHAWRVLATRRRRRDHSRGRGRRSCLRGTSIILQLAQIGTREIGIEAGRKARKKRVPRTRRVELPRGLEGFARRDVILSFGERYRCEQECRARGA